MSVSQTTVQSPNWTGISGPASVLKCRKLLFIFAKSKCAAWHTAGLACELQMQSAEQLSAFSAEGLRSGGRSLQQPWLDIFPYFRGGGGRIKIWGEIWAFRGAFFLYPIGKFKPFIEIILWKNIDPCTAQTRLATQPAS